MFENKKIYLWILGIIIIVIMIMIFIFKNNKNMTMDKDTTIATSTSIEYRDLNQNIMVNKKILEVSELQTQLDDFYNISIDNFDKNVTLKKNTSNSLIEIETLLTRITINNDTAILDNMMIDFLKNQNISRIDKINGLWGLIQDINPFSEKGLYLLDYLATLHPIELTDKMIVTYEKHDDNKLKAKIIDLLSSSINIANPNIQDEKRLNFIREQTEAIELFLEAELMDNRNPELFDITLTSFANIAETDKVQTLISSILERENQSVLNDKQLVKTLTEIAISTDEAQENILPNILNSMNMDSTSEEKKRVFNQEIIDILNNNILNQEAKNELSDYLTHQEPQLSVQKDISIEVLEEYYSWASATSKIKNSNDIGNILFENTNPLKIASILLFSDEVTIKKIKNSENVEELSRILELSLDDELIQNENKVIIEDAINVIKSKK